MFLALALYVSVSCVAVACLRANSATSTLLLRVSVLASYMDAQGESLASVALRYSIWRAQEAGRNHGIHVSTITGISTLDELAENVSTVKKLLQGNDLLHPTLNLAQVEMDRPLFDKAHSTLGDWVNRTFTIPAEGWDPELKCMVKQDAVSDIRAIKIEPDGHKSFGGDSRDT
jgi:hypothetical protein